MIRKKAGALFATMFILSTTFAFAQSPFELNVLEIEAQISFDKVHQGSKFDLAIVVNVDEEYHINANQPTEEFLIPTQVRFDPVDRLSFGRVIYPDPHVVKFAFSDQPLAVYEKEFVIFAEVFLADDFPLGELELSGTLGYQACTDQNCYAPSEEPFSIMIDVVNAGVEIISSNEDLFRQLEAHSQEEALAFTSDELRAKAVLEKGLPYAIIAFFLFGLALNLTPCVYPVIPITVGYFGSQSERRKGSSFVSALFYVIGIAIVFSILGLISGLAGKQWGFLFQNPWFVITISLIILAMAASMFGAFEITVPSSLMNRFGGAREGVVGAFIMGLTVGVVIAPCAAGIIIGLVGLVAKLGIVAKGTLLFFIMGLGLGVPYLILATFSGLLNKIPKSGMWMVWVRKLFGVLLIGVALYFLAPQIKRVHDLQGYMFGILAMFGGLLLGFLDQAHGYTKNFKFGRAVFGILVLLFGIFMTHKAIHTEPPAIDWVHYQNETIDDLIAQDKPVIMDFYADWCAPCKQMDNETFTNDLVVGKTDAFTMLKVDCTSPDERIKLFMEAFEVTGMPTFIFLNSKGEEIRELRAVGYVAYDSFLEKMEKALE